MNTKFYNRLLSIALVLSLLFTMSILFTACEEKEDVAWGEEGEWVMIEEGWTIKISYGYYQENYYNSSSSIVEYRENKDGSISIRSINRYLPQQFAVARYPAPYELFITGRS